MTIFLDASAMVAIMTDEPDAFDLERRFGMVVDRLCSALSLWETVRAIARKRKISVSEACLEVDAFVADFAIRLVSIDAGEASAAIVAHERYGKGSGHPARLNMGDCFAYACARTNGARLLYKGDDFVHTDLG
ncbi:type II toxin-antitoxin system VapC family toxin [uncultured Sphingomonas sp.]|uniref:type II toxin-antitoxin system VapC family toxin n=1 Tax=uncultured Sphingomonas sp. TaxID=158754 RepID=UPI0035CC9C3F